MTGGKNGKHKSEIRAARRALSLFAAVVAMMLVCGKLVAGTPQQLQITRIVIAVVAGAFALFCAFNWKTTFAFMRAVIFAKDAATNVAIFRIISFSTIWWLLYNEPIFGSFECQEIWHVPFGIGWLPEGPRRVRGRYAGRR